GYALMLLGTSWFLWNLNAENISDFAAYKRLMLIGFAAVGVATCIYVRDFLAVRGLAIVFLLLAKLMVDTARWADTGWRLVIVTWADRKSTRLNSSHVAISYAVFCLKKKNKYARVSR